MNIKSRFFSIALFALALSLQIFASESKILKQDSHSVTINFQFSKSSESIVPGTDGKNFSVVQIEGTQPLREFGQPVVPVYTTFIALPAKRAGVKIISENHTEMVLKFPNLITVDSLNTERLASAHNRVELKYQGLYRGVPLFAVSVFPVQLNGKSATVFKEITVQIESEKNSLQTISKKPAAGEKDRLSHLILNSRSVNYRSAEAVSYSSQQSTFPFKPGRFKILVNQDGLYHIGYSDLAKSGFPVSSVEKSKIRMYNRGVEIPVYVGRESRGTLKPGDYIEFWGEVNQSPYLENSPEMVNDPYTDVNVYWLEVADQNGLRLVDESGALIQTRPGSFIVPFAFTDKVHVEKDASFIHFGQPSANVNQPSYTLDHWYFDSGISAVGSRTYTFDLKHPLKTGQNSVYVDVMLRGLSYFSEFNPLDSHEAEIWLNDYKVGKSALWRNQEWHKISNANGIALPQSNIQDGENSLRVTMEQTGVTDIVALNWFDVSYQRLYRADDDIIRFRKQQGIPEGFTLQFEIDGFGGPDIDVYKIGVSKITQPRIDLHTDQQNITSYRISFQDNVLDENTEYIALRSDQKLAPLAIVEDVPWKSEEPLSSLLSRTNRADYVIITNDSLYEASQEYANYRLTSGLKVEVVKVQDIYDEFNYGIKSPLAIKDFLAYAFENWSSVAPLYYVLFAGDASLNYRSDTDGVPSFLFETFKYGAAASDFYYSLISGDDFIPDLAIGRIPARNEQELTNYFNKMVAYEAHNDRGEWRNTGLFISGNDASTRELNSEFPAFRAQNQRIINFHAPRGYFVRKLNTVRNQDLPGFDPNFGSTTDLINYMDDGVSFINFFGHGGGAIWADVQLFNLQDVDRLNNETRLPFVKSMTCFTGAFESPSRLGLAEKLITIENKGAIGVFASSGLGWLHNDFAVGWTLTDYLFEKNLNIGEAVQLAKIFYLNNNLYVAEDFNTAVPSYFLLKESMVNQYNLLGDPFVRLTLPDNTLSLTPSKSYLAVGDTLDISIAGKSASASGTIELANQYHEPLIKQFFSLNAGTGSASFIIPQEADSQKIFVKAYYEQDGTEERGFTNVSVQKNILNSISYFPEQPQVGDSFSVAIDLITNKSIDSMVVTVPNVQGLLVNYTFLKESETRFNSPGFFPAYTTPGERFLTVNVWDSEGTVLNLGRQLLDVLDPRPDIEVVEESVTFAGMTGISAEAQFRNMSDSLMQSVAVGLYLNPLTSSSTPLAVQNIRFEPHQRQTVSFDISQNLLSPDARFSFYADFLDGIDESNEQNNIDSSLIFNGNIYLVDPSIGTTQNGGSNDTVNILSVARLFIPAGALSNISVMKLALLNNDDLIQGNNQPGMTWIPFAAGVSDTSFLKIDFLNPQARFTASGWLGFDVDSTTLAGIPANELTLCRYDLTSNSWKRINTTISGRTISTRFTAGGIFALFRFQDSDAPEIEISVNGRVLRDAMLVPKQPELSIILQDANGVNFDQSFYVMVDNDTLDRQIMSLPDTIGDSRVIPIQVNPNFSSGQHVIKVFAADNNNNQGLKTVTFVVAGGFNVVVYGNYPNPFEDETVISYFVNTPNPLDAMTIKLYTISGRLIRNLNAGFQDPTFKDPDYHEVIWDGRDDDGNLVANGVYFAVIRGVYQGKNKETTLKIAKLK